MYPGTAMSSQRRIDSSRANGAKSRGPVTAEGKRKSSQNSARHGLLAQCIVLEDEVPERFHELLADLIREHNPQTETQLGLVETMAMARWRVMRLWAIEREVIEEEIDRTPPGENGPAARAGLAFRTLADNGRVLDLLNRYESRLDRQYARALNLLMKLASPENPLTQFHSGVGLPACPAAEGGSPQAPVDPEPARQPSPPLTQSRQANPVGRASRPVQVAEGDGLQPSTDPTPTSESSQTPPPLTQSRQTNPSGTGLLAGPAAEGGSPHPSTNPEPSPRPFPSHMNPPRKPKAA